MECEETEDDVMRKCSSPKCGAEGPGDFCEECGHEMQEEQKTDIVVMCDGKLKNGDTCGAVLKPKKKFCSSCGTKVNPALFSAPALICECGTKLEADAKFCDECGKEIIKAELTESETKPVVATTAKTDAKDDEHNTNTRSQKPRDESYVHEIDQGAIAYTSVTADDICTSTNPNDHKDNVEITEPANLQLNASSCQTETDENMHTKTTSDQIEPNIGDLKIIDGKPDNSINSDVNISPESGEKGTDQLEENENGSGKSVKRNGKQKQGEDKRRKLDTKSDHEETETDSIGNCKAFDITSDDTAHSICSSTNTNDVKDNVEITKPANSQVDATSCQTMTNENMPSQITRTNIGHPRIVDEKPDESINVEVNISSALGENSNDQLEGNVNCSGKLVKQNGNKKQSEDKTRKLDTKSDHEETETDSNGNCKAVDNTSDDRHSSDRMEEDIKEPSEEPTSVDVSDGHKDETNEDLYVAGRPSSANEGFVFGGAVRDQAKNKSARTQQAPASESGLFDTPKNRKSTVSEIKIQFEESDESRQRTDNMTNDAEGTDVDKGTKGPETRSQAKAKKNDKNKKDNQNNNANTKSKGKSDPKGSRHGGDKCISVHFHVLTDNEFKFDPSKFQCFVMLGSEELGGFHSYKHQMQVLRHIKDSVYELTYEVSIPTRLVAGGSTIPYHYLFKKKEKDEIRECYLQNNKVNETERQLNVSLSLKGLEVWHQYDGYAEHGPQGLIDKLFDFVKGRKKQLIAHAESAIDLFCPEPIDKCVAHVHPEAILNKTKMLRKCMRRIYYFDGKCWRENGQFDIFFAEKLVQAMLQKGKIETKLQSTVCKDRDDVTCVAITIAVLLHTMKLPMPDVRSIHILTKALLVRSDVEKKECPDLNIVDNIFPKQRELVRDSILSVVKYILKHFKDPCWMSLMPLVHFLSGACVPFQEPHDERRHDDAVPVWWGLDLVAEEHELFTQKNGPWDIPMENMLKHLQPLFVMDYLLPRTFMASVELDQLGALVETKHVPIEVVLANLVYQLISNKPIAWHSSYLTPNEKVIEGIINKVLKQLQEEFFSDEKSLKQWETCYQISHDLFRQSLDNGRINTIIYCTQIQIHCVAMYDRILGQNNGTKSKKKELHIDYLNKSWDAVVSWMNRWFDKWYLYMQDNVKAWNLLFAASELQSENVKNIWNKALADSFMATLKNNVLGFRDRMKTFIHLYCQNVDSYNPQMQECLTNAALVAIQKGHDIDYNRFNDYESRRYGGLLSHLFETEWNKSVGSTNYNREEKIFLLILRWSAFPLYLNIYYKDKNKMKMLTDNCVQNLILAVSVVESKLTELLDGTITVGDFNLILLREKKFPELVELIKKDCTATFVTKALQIRHLEMKEFQLQASQMSLLSSLCQHLLEIDRHPIDSTLKKQENLDRHQLREFCNPANVEQVVKVEDFHPDLCAFKVSDAVFEMVPELKKLDGSSTFMNLWTAQCRDSKVVELDEVVEAVWRPVQTRLKHICEQITTGCIRFTDFEKDMGNVYKDDYGGMEREMNILDIPPKIQALRIHQLKEYRQLEACVQGAKVILKFAKQYNLTGDFEQIRVIASHGQNAFEMRSFDDSVMKACDFLRDLTPKRASCLNTFVKCGKLVDWLKESMKKGGLKELKVFVDLAYLSAGDEPMNIARVQCLHTAVTGYAPLIFDLTPDCGYEGLLDYCAVVWKELENNPRLPKMLEDTNHQLEWMKEIKKAHGSVEVTSLMQAEAINANGVYTVGRNAWKRRQQTHQDTPSLMVLADVLELSVKETAGKTLKNEPRFRSYTFSQLQDLQSRLMLVAGKAEKGSDSVDRFTMIFDSLTRLSNVYLKLCSSGCVLFKDWTARFFCDPNPKRPVCVNLAFGMSEDAPQMRGRRSETEDLEDLVPEIARFMEKCLDEWLDYIKEKRKSYLHLNYFTVDQLVILQRELVKVGSDDGPSHLIYPLLSAVKQDCTPADLSEAISKAGEDIKQHLDMDNKMVNMETDMLPSKPGNEENSEEERKLDFVRKLVEADYHEKLAFEAAKHVEDYDVNQGIVWCIEHEDMFTSGEDAGADDAVEEEMDVNPVVQMPALTCMSESMTDIQSLIRQNISELQNDDVGVEPLIQSLNVLWRQFLESISSNIRDYLSLEHLGLILRYLSRRGTQTINRSLLPVFKEGQPNLVICPSVDVLMTTLSVYVNNQDQPLPQSDEVLMCTPNTTKDEVDIFWRRAIYDDSRKIHCLVNADMLDYDVGEAAERCLEQYLQDVYHEEMAYRLLVICSSENENRSTIISSLDKYKRHLLPFNIDTLRQYLLRNLQVLQSTQSKVKSAAYVDNERSTVRVVKSWRAGVGKSLFKIRREDTLSSLNRAVRSGTVSIPLQEKNLDIHYVIERLLEHTTRPGEVATRLFHIDVSHEVQNGIDYLLFNLLILGCLMDKTGWVWRKSPMDYYLIETVPLMMQAANRQGDLLYVHTMLRILPDVTCRSPVESANIYQNGQNPNTSDQLFDAKLFRSPTFQRPYQYLLRLDQGRQLEDVHPHVPEGDPQSCLLTLLRHCGLEDPSWSELHHFVWFLNTQLVDFEQNNFVGPAAADLLPGFAKFVLRFLLQMSKDFSTRSLNMSEESPHVGSDVQESASLVERMETDDNDKGDEDDETVLQAYQMRRTWESSPHPYLFFNSDRFTFTFLGFNIDKGSGNLIDQQTGTVLEQNIMRRELYDGLINNHAPLQENFDNLPRQDKILKLCNVMGIDMPHDPDNTYELTTDNVKKMLAIYMRFRCDIPVIIMGETGCGKTRLIKFMCALQVPPGLEVTNMILMKVHGGTTHADIVRKVQAAEEVAIRNKETINSHMYTVLFFDEANTTESIGLIKEIMCDKSMGGKRLRLCENLKIVAACNPYRKHSEELIKKLEQAGLGYHVDADETTDRLGRVPMRRLVYRVQPLPHSLLPLVWDFGQLNTQVEELYIRQMVRRYINEDRLPNIHGLIEVVSAILTASQDYMRDQKDECSFVSLRDVERVLTVMSWFYLLSETNDTLFNLMDIKLYGEDNNDEREDENDDDLEEEDDGPEILTNERVDRVTRSLILALGVCYHACLKTRPQYRRDIARYFQAPCQLPGGHEQMKEEIESCQEVFLDHVNLEKNIARNMALKENIFMMVVCIELRIPLFLVGKPGSSKSLAKTIVSDAMQGNASRHLLFKDLKQAQMVSFQCSPLSTPDGIVGTFRQCAQFQKDKDLETYVSVVVLDEVGLAEDSPRMPLKTLHPLLEDGCQGDETPEKYKKVAFIGISNWALDPAKMNRGILVQREVPDLEELKNSAMGICATEDDVAKWIEPLIEPMATSYLDIFNKASKEMREFYGLRDFYSLVKMVYSFVEKSRRRPTWHEMLHSIKRNFGGLDQVNPVESFKKHLSSKILIEPRPQDTDPDCTPAGLIHACLFDTNEMRSESRYLLLLTENYGTLGIIQQVITSRESDIRPITIFGSSFRSDQEYTQVCRNINKIKVCMETGNTVVLLNLENLYESLYDALNQYYVYFGGERYVDLGLGTHRVKCPVHKKFRLIVVAEKQTVYDKFPIPLINRLEKHFLNINTLLSDEQQQSVQQLMKWTKDFVTERPRGFRTTKQPEIKIGEVFIGYHDDTCSAIVLNVSEQYKDVPDVEERLASILKESKSMLLWSATPESLVKLENGPLPRDEQMSLQHIYSKQQAHSSLIQYLHRKIVEEETDRALFAQVTTHSKLIASIHKKQVSEATGIETGRILLLETLSSFDTEQQFTNRILQHMKSMDSEPSLMIIQCDSGDANANLIACARYCVLDEFEKLRDESTAPIHVVFIVQLPRGATFTGFQCGKWHSVHIDDLYTEDMNMPTLEDMQEETPAGLLKRGVDDTVAMETDEIPERNLEAMDTEEHQTLSDDDLQSHIGQYDAIGEEGIRLDDVLINLNTVDNRQRKPREGKTKLNVKGLILDSVQAALGMVKDQVENTNKETDRVSLVLTLLHQESVGDQATFLRGICSLIAKLLEEKESKTQSTEMTHHWLVNEAASKESINKAGTFRRSCLLTLMNKIAPMLAAIIACLDTNDNMKILQDDKSSWKQKFWLRMLNTKDAVQLQYEDLKSPTRQSELREFIVKTTGYEQHSFAAKFPFSWLIIPNITEILKLSADDDKVDGIGKVENAVRVLSSTPNGEVVRTLNYEADLNEVMEEYVHDYIHTMYNAESDAELQLVCESVRFKARAMISECPGDGDLLQSLVYIHLAYESLARRLTYFREMNNVWKECSEHIIKLKKEKPDHFMFQEQEFTFSAHCLVLENLTPKQLELNDPLGRSRWLKKVHQYRPVVEKVISLHGEDPSLYGYHSEQSVFRAKGLWNRVLCMKLFLEHVCSTGRENKISVKHCMPLWTLLGDQANLKEINSLEAVEKFLKSCNKQAMKQYYGSEVKCCACEVVLEGPPIVLPCEHPHCDECFHDMKMTEDLRCAKCQKVVPENWVPVKQENKKEALDILMNYQKRCNSFFMDVVSQLCFADNTAPSAEVVDKLLGYIFFTSRGKQQHQLTKELTVLNTGLDHNPVFRSFLLQLLMRTSEEQVQQYLSDYLRRAEDLIKKDGEVEARKHYIELSLLVIQCIEDKLVQETSRRDGEKNNEAYCALYALQSAIRKINDDELTVDKLYALAGARMGLAVAMKYVAMAMKEERNVIDENMRQVLIAAKRLNDHSQINWIRVYALKYLCRNNGIEMYQKVCDHPLMMINWLADPEERNRTQVEEVVDRYIVCGDTYRRIRESLTKVLLGENVKHLSDTLQELHVHGAKVELMFQLAAHRELTCSHIRQNRRIAPEVEETVKDLVGNCDIFKDKDLLYSLMQNELVPGHLVSQRGQPLRVQGLQCLIFHFLSMMSHLKGNRTLLSPLLNLWKKPEACNGYFLPTMPQDDLDDVREALLAARNQVQGADHNPVFYRCPNGHPYVIGDCGRPATVGNCRDCGAVIGGEGYRLRPRNIQLQGGDQTMTGHILGRADRRAQRPVPERGLTPPTCATVRLIVHLCMYLGCRVNPNGILTMIKPDIMPNEVVDFIWDHILHDIEDIHVALDRSVDDVFLFMHILVDFIMKHYNAGEVVPGDCNLTSKAGRKNWETQFAARYLQPVLENLDDALKRNNQHIAQDQRLGANPLLCTLYETENPAEDEIPSRLQYIPRVWRYRTPISLQHVQQEVNARVSAASKSQTSCRVLKLFLDEEHNLRALRYIPSILRLHRALFQKYQRKLDKAEASQITVLQLKKDSVAGSETFQLLQDFAEVWELVRKNLDQYLCPTIYGGVIVPKEYCNQSVTDKTPVSMLLPTIKEAGLCSYVLLDYLMRKQNDFLDKYLKESKRKSASLNSIPPREVTAAHLISYDPEHDILPLILANCQYSFEMGKGTKIEYDFTGLERQLMDRFLFSKSRIEVGSILQIDEMVYRTEFTNALVFMKLSEKIPQTPLTTVVKTQITEEFKSLPDLCQSLDNLDITISFLKTTGGAKESNLYKFMVDILCMSEVCLSSQRAKQACEFQHSKSLWLLLSLLKAKKMVDIQQHTETIFESVSRNFHEELPVDLRLEFDRYMKNLSVEKLTQLVEVLHEFILLKVAVPENPENEDFLDTAGQKLGGYLYAYAEELDIETLDMKIFDGFPDEILCKHSVYTWISAYNTLHTKQTGQRRY